MHKRGLKGRGGQDTLSAIVDGTLNLLTRTLTKTKFFNMLCKFTI